MDQPLGPPEDFKETAIGLLPAEWEIARLGEVAHINLGQSPPSSTYNTKGDGLPFLQGKSTFGRVFPTPERWCSAPKRIAEPGSVLISVRAPVGDVNIAQDEYCIGRGLTALNGESTLDNWFLFYVLISSKHRLESKSTGSTFKSINKGILKSFPIPLPPLAEQQCIAAALRTIQEAIAAQEDVITAARELKRSLMERLFTYGHGAELASTNETRFGEVPEHWEIMPLDEYAYIQTGAAKGRGLDDSEVIEVPYLRVANVQDGYLDLTEIKHIRIRKSEVDRYSLQAGDVVLTEDMR